MKFRIRRTRNKELVFQLSDKLFGRKYRYDSERNVYWLVFDERNRPVGFAQATTFPYGEVFFSRSGILPCARGHDLQVRLIKVRETWARKNGHKSLVTYTSTDNGPSIKSLLKCGFKIYQPDWAYAGKEMIYFSKDLNDECISLPRKL